LHYVFEEFAVAFPFHLNEFELASLHLPEHVKRLHFGLSAVKFNVCFRSSRGLLRRIERADHFCRSIRRTKANSLFLIVVRIRISSPGTIKARPFLYILETGRMSA